MSTEADIFNSIIEVEICDLADKNKNLPIHVQKIIQTYINTNYIPT